MPEPAGASQVSAAQAGAPAHDAPATRALSIASSDQVTLAGEESGSGPAVVLLHGLTSSRRYVVHGSRTLERSGYRVISYDARGHGSSTPPVRPAAPAEESAVGGGGARAGASAREPSPYGYRRLTGDLGAVLDATGVRRAVLAGVSMGAHTIVRFALDHPERVAALAIITPAFDPDGTRPQEVLESWDKLARGLREGGIEGFLAAYDVARLPAAFQPTLATVIRQRMALHEHLDAVADALEAVPRSRPFGELSQLAAIAVPTVVIADRDEADPRHPLAVGERYAEAIPGAQLRVEEPGKSPLAWQGGQVSKIIAELAARGE
jgi:pimeloyl-ACP methyl ester carboxylesterase